MTRYHDLVFNNRLFAGRRRYLTQYVENYPLPEPASKEAREIVRIVRELVLGNLTLAERQEREAAIEIGVATAFGVDPIMD